MSGRLRWCAASGCPVQGRGAADAGGPHLHHDDPVVVGDVGLAGRSGRDPGGDGGHRRLLAAAVLPVGEHVSRRGWSTPRTSSTCPGRPKTDRLDAVWLCKVAERQMLRPSFVPPPAFRELRDLTRYRVDLITARTAEKQRVEKLLEDALIKVSVVVSDVFGVSGRADDGGVDRRGTRPEGPGASWPAGRCGARPAGWRRRSPAGSPSITRSCCHGCWPGSTRINADIDTVQARIDEQIAPFAKAVARLG